MNYVDKIKNHADPKAIQEIAFNESMFDLTILEKIKETRLKFSQESVTVLQKMVNYQEGRIKLTIMQLNKLRSAAKKPRQEEY